MVDRARRSHQSNSLDVAASSFLLPPPFAVITLKRLKKHGLPWTQMFTRLDTTGRTTVQPPSCSKRSPPRLPLSQWANGTTAKARRIGSTHFITDTRGT